MINNSIVPLFEDFTQKVEASKVPRLSINILNLLNTQIMNEIDSERIYKAMSIYLHDNDMLNASKYFFDESNEEHDHANKIYGYMFDMNCTPVVPKNVLDVRVEFTDVRDVIATSLAHEIVLSNAWNNIANVAKQEGDNATLSFALSFVNEQIEEENKFRDILSKIDSGMPNWELDTQFK